MGAQGRDLMKLCPTAVFGSQIAFVSKAARLYHLSRSAAVWKGGEEVGNMHTFTRTPSKRAAPK